MFRVESVGFTGLAVTYSPASWDAVPSARRRLTAEFGKGSGVSLALLPPNLESPRVRRPLERSRGGIHETVFSDDTWGLRLPPEDGSAVFRIG